MNVAQEYNGNISGNIQRNFSVSISDYQENLSNSLNGPAAVHSENGNLNFLAPVQTKLMQPILVSLYIFQKK